MTASVIWKTRKFLTTNGRANAAASAAPIARARLVDAEVFALARCTACAWGVVRLSSMRLDPAHHPSSEQPARHHHQHRDDEDERDGELELAPHIRDEGSGEVF